MLCVACTHDPAPATARPAAWAQEIADRPGLGNLHKITDALYRGEQPEERGFAELKAMGIKTVVNLRTLHSDRTECEANGLDYAHITVQAWEAEDAEVLEFLGIVTDPARQPVFVHCQHGADRTGMMSAVYRIVVQGWSKAEAIRELKQGGYGYHPMWKDLIRYLEALDVDALETQLERARSSNPDGPPAAH